MYKSEKFGKIFWVDGDLNLKCCPQWADGTGDFEQTEYVTDWIDWEAVDMKALLDVYKYLVCKLRNNLIKHLQPYKGYAANTPLVQRALKDGKKSRFQQFKAVLDKTHSLREEQV